MRQSGGGLRLDLFRRYSADVIHTLLTTKARWLIVVVALAYVMAWLFFAVLYYIAWTQDQDCLVLVDDFWDTFLLSLETQVTIGYGARNVATHCLSTTTILVCQAIFGYLMDATLLGLIFAKISRPQRRARTVRFSRCIVMADRDGIPCLMIRVADLRSKGPLVQNYARLLMYSDYTTSEGEHLPFYCQPLRLDEDHENERPIFLTPWTLVHHIDESSPLYGLSLKELERRRAEFVAIVEGTIQPTGLTLQIRASYFPAHMRPNRRFVPVCSRTASGNCNINWDDFDAIEPAPFTGFFDIDTSAPRNPSFSHVTKLLPSSEMQLQGLVREAVPLGSDVDNGAVATTAKDSDGDSGNARADQRAVDSTISSHQEASL